MSHRDTDPRLSPRAVRLAQPLMARFVRSSFCPVEHVWHARSTLPLLAMYVAMADDVRAERLPWEALDPDALLRTSLELSPSELSFIQDLLDLSASFYAFLGAEGEVSWQHAEAIRGRLAQLAMGVASMAA